MNRIFIGFLSVVASSIAMAGSVSSNGHKVTAVMSGYEHKGMFIETSGDLVNPNNYSNWINSSKRTIAAIPARSEVDHVLSLALAAKFAQSDVDMLVYDNICHEGWPVLHRIRVN